MRRVLGLVVDGKVFLPFLREQDMGLWVCRKADPESKGCVENAVGYVKKNYFSARALAASRASASASVGAWIVI